MALTFKRICRGAITSTSQPHGEELIPVDTNEPTSYVGRWDVSRTANDSVRAYLTGTSPNYELHFYGYGATANYAQQSSAPYYTAPWASRTSQITRLIFHDGITDIGQLTFFGRKSAGISPGDFQRIGIVMSDTVRVLQRYAIYYAPLLSVELSNGLRRIGEGSLFVSNDNQAITIPNCLRIADYTSVIGYSTAGTYPWLHNQTLSGGYFIAGDGVLMWGRPTGTMWSIPEGVKSVACFRWDNYANVTSVTLPSTTKYIATFAFGDYTGITKFKIPQGTEYISNNAFARMTGLQKIWIPRSVTIISTDSIVTGTGLDTHEAYVFNSTPNVTVYCEIDSSEVPEGWSEYWNYIASGTQLTVVWNTSEAEFDAM